MPVISGKALGRKQPLFADWSFPLPPEWSDAGGLTLRQFLERVVRDQVAGFERRQHDRQFLRALSATQIQDAAAQGKIAMGDSDVAPQPVDVEAAIGAAWQAFEDGLYLVVVDGEEQKSLDRQIYLQPDSAVTFVRLTLLAGG